MNAPSGMTRTDLVPYLLVSALAVGCGSKSDSLPKLTPELMPPAASPLFLGKSTEADVLAKVAKDPAPEVKKDKSLGGDGQVMFNEHKSIWIGQEAFGEAYLWSDGGGAPVLGRLALKQTDACAWVNEHIGKLEGAKNCPGNRKTGASNGTSYFCASLDDHVVHIECSGTTIEYWLGKKR